MTPQADELITLARIVRPQGRHGEVLADCLTDFPLSLPGRTGLLLERPGGQRAPVEITSAWLPTGRNQGRIVLKLAGCDSIAQAEGLRSAAIQIEQRQRLALKDFEFYISDLEGCQVFDRGLYLGDVTGVQQLPASGGAEPAPLLVVRTADSREALVPLVRAYVQQVDVEQKRITTELPDGLLELDQP